MKASCGINTTAIVNIRPTIFRLSDCCHSAASLLQNMQKRLSKFTQGHLFCFLPLKLVTKFKISPSGPPKLFGHLHQRNDYLKSRWRRFLFCLAESFTPSLLQLSTSTSFSLLS